MNELATATRKLDLTLPGACKLLTEYIRTDIDRWCVETWTEEHRSHLGASLIGHDCTRYLWYIFRWCAPSRPIPRMLRLFNRGHLEELRYVRYLQGIGCTITGHREEGQERVSACGQHFGGSLDGRIVFPARYGITEPLLAEFKTKSTGKGFEKLKASGVRMADPQHFAQMSTYGRLKGYRFALYMSTNKNDDDMHIEVLPLEPGLADEMVKRAEYVINSPTPPNKLALDPTFWQCRVCDFQQICHHNVRPSVNCRSCKFAQPVDNAEWYCHQWKGIIPKAEIPKACPSHSPITVQ